MKSVFPIAGIQMGITFGQDNVPKMEAKLAALMHRFPWVEMVFFSELASHGASLAHAQVLPGPWEEKFQQLAAQHKIWLIPGSVFEKVGEQIYNTAPVIAPDGTVIARYRKMFPFRPYEQGVTAGSEFCIFDIPDVGRFGLVICYDLWFPEVARTLTAMGAEVILRPALTDTIDRDVELAISRATAAQNQCFIFDLNGCWSGGNGRSIVVRPTGTVLHEASSVEEFIPVDIDLATARRVRETGMFGLGQVLKSFRDREVEFDVYRRESGQAAYLDTLGPLVVPSRRIRADEDPAAAAGIPAPGVPVKESE